MKRIALLTLLLLALIGSHGYAQMRAPTAVDLAWTSIGIAQSLEGSWRASQSDEGKLVLQKCDTPFCWGQYFKFMPEGKMNAGYAVPCGNDPNYRFYSGTWTWDSGTRTLRTSTTFEEEVTAAFRIEKVNEKELVLSRIN